MELYLRLPALTRPIKLATHYSPKSLHSVNLRWQFTAHKQARKSIHIYVRASTLSGLPDHFGSYINHVANARDQFEQSCMITRSNNRWRQTPRVTGQFRPVYRTLKLRHCRHGVLFCVAGRHLVENSNYFSGFPRRVQLMKGY